MAFHRCSPCSPDNPVRLPDKIDPPARSSTPDFNTLLLRAYFFDARLYPVLNQDQHIDQSGEGPGPGSHASQIGRIEGRQKTGRIETDLKCSFLLIRELLPAPLFSESDKYIDGYQKGTKTHSCIFHYTP